MFGEGVTQKYREQTLEDVQMRMTDAGGKMMNRYVEAFTDLMHSSSINLMRMVSDVDNKRVF